MNYTGRIDPLGPFEPRIESPKSNLPFEAGVDLRRFSSA